jgi:hypothetical protein
VQLQTAIEDLADPARHLPWLEGHTLNASDFFAHFHAEHDADLRAWLARVEK